MAKFTKSSLINHFTKKKKVRAKGGRTPSTPPSGSATAFYDIHSPIPDPH